MSAKTKLQNCRRPGSCLVCDQIEGLVAGGLPGFKEELEEAWVHGLPGCSGGIVRLASCLLGQAMLVSVIGGRVHHFFLAHGAPSQVLRLHPHPILTVSSVLLTDSD